MWTYEQKTGKLHAPDGSLAGTGWAGQQEGYNNPDMQDVAGIGPLPRGLYTISKAYKHPHLGPVTMNLQPDPANQMFGRSLFRFHGASSSAPELSSHGCIIMPRTVRDVIAASADRTLLVV